MARELLTLTAEDNKAAEAIRTETAIEDVKVDPVKTAAEKPPEEIVSAKQRLRSRSRIAPEPPKRDRVVPIQAVHEERQKRQALQRELDELHARVRPPSRPGFPTKPPSRSAPSPP